MKRFASLCRIAGMLAVFFVGLVMFQVRQLYFPEAAPLSALLPASESSEQSRAWPSADAFRALLFEPADTVIGTVVVFHGNAGHAGHRLFYVDALQPLGWRVLLAEYPGYGPRDGRLGEDSLVADAADTLVEARRRFGPLVVLGESLGAGVAAAAIARTGDSGIAGLVLITPWDTLPEVAAHHYGGLPRWLLDRLLRDRYDSIGHLRGFRGPATVVLASDDAVVPAARGHALFAALGAAARLRIVEGAGHNDWPDRVDARWWRELMVPYRSPAAAAVD
jgi:predicted alpha/beta hydrolase family esterase